MTWDTFLLNLGTGAMGSLLAWGISLLVTRSWRNSRQQGALEKELQIGMIRDMGDSDQWRLEYLLGSLNFAAQWFLIGVAIFVVGWALAPITGWTLFGINPVTPFLAGATLRCLYTAFHGLRLVGNAYKQAVLNSNTDKRSGAQVSQRKK